MICKIEEYEKMQKLRTNVYRTNNDFLNHQKSLDEVIVSCKAFYDFTKLMKCKYGKTINLEEQINNNIKYHVNRNSILTPHEKFIQRNKLNKYSAEDIKKMRKIKLKEATEINKLRWFGAGVVMVFFISSILGLSPITSIQPTKPIMNFSQYKHMYKFT